MQTFQDSKGLARSKDINNLFGQNSTFKLSAEAEAGSAEEQPARNRLTDGNDKAVGDHPAASIEKSFLL